MTLVRGKGAMSSRVSTYHEELRDPAEFEDEGKFIFGHVLHNNLRLVGRHILVGIRVFRVAIGLLDLVDALVAKDTDKERVRWEHEANERDPELEAGHALHDHGKDDLPDGEPREDSHQGQLLDQSVSL